MRSVPQKEKDCIRSIFECGSFYWMGDKLFQVVGRSLVCYNWYMAVKSSLYACEMLFANEKAVKTLRSLLFALLVIVIICLVDYRYNFFQGIAGD
jgi:hypothetical protein